MDLTVTQLPMLLPAYVLVLSRIGGLMVTAPLFSSNAIPRRVKVALSMVIALAVFPLVGARSASQISLPDAFVGAVGEIMIGLIMGAGMSIVFLGAELAGTLVGQQAGLALGQVFNPLLESETSALGQLYSIVHMLIFLAIGGQRQLMRGLLDTFAAAPVLAFRHNDAVVALAAELMGGAFMLAIRLAGPVLTALTLTTLAMGVVSRAMPQLNVLSVGFSVQILVALLVGGVALSMAGDALTAAIVDGLERIRAAYGLAAA